MGPVGYVNGRYVPASEVMMPVADAGFAWGAVITDRLRTFGGRPFRLSDHVSRFHRSCELARVPQPRADAELETTVRRLIQENWSGADLTIVLLAAPGPNLIAYTQLIDQERLAVVRRAGIRLVAAPTFSAVDPRIKHRSRLNWWIAAARVREVDPEAEPLIVDSVSGRVLETPTANLLAVFDGAVTAPPAGTVLDGVSLAVVRELCSKLAIPFAERPLSVADLAGASELLLTNTSYSIAGASRLDGRDVSFPGPLLNRLLDAWSDLVGTDLRRPPRS
jgi:branched-chain amino acid aminotransferase